MEWKKGGVPHKGWACINVIDIKENMGAFDSIEYEQCEMCGNEKIRFVHIMKHPQYPKTLRVGCVCAEKMSGDYVNPRRNEESLRKRAMRKSNFDKREWSYNPTKKTYSKKYKGEYITIMKSRYGNWGVFFANYRFWTYNDKKILSFEDAKKVAFKVFEKYHTTKEEREYLDY